MQITKKITLVLILLLVLQFSAEAYYREPLFEYSLSAKGIKRHQANAPEWMKSILKIETHYGSGKEIKFASFLVLIFAPRSRYFYYIILLGLSKFGVPIVKMMIVAPRPFWLDLEIEPYKCSLCFGSPSGHAFAAALAASAFFLDVFHGNLTTTMKNWSDERIFFSAWTYYSSLLFALLWILSMGYSRYLGGMHSLDQILCGNILGFYCSYIAHFLVRDPLIRYMDHIIHVQ